MNESIQKKRKSVIWIILLILLIILISIIEFCLFKAFLNNYNANKKLSLDGYHYYTNSYSSDLEEYEKLKGDTSPILEDKYKIIDNYNDYEEFYKKLSNIKKILKNDIKIKEFDRNFFKNNSLLLIAEHADSQVLYCNLKCISTQDDTITVGLNYSKKGDVGGIEGVIYYIVIDKNIKKVSEYNSNTENNTKNPKSNFQEFNIVNIDKPIIYLYPTEETKVNVKLLREENITCSYPKYNSNGWNVIANPNGDLIDIDTNRKLYSLYWEGKNITTPKMDEGFVIEGSKTAKFLEDKLSILGLNDRESEEFIIYWLPQLEKNKYNFIRFKSLDEINQNMPLKITPTQDTIIRVVMEWKPLDEYTKVKEQKLETPLRNGFTVVEWGATKIE